MRGERFHNQFAQPVLFPEQPAAGKGRRPDLQAQRHRKIACRYYYKARILRLQWEQALSELSIEFDLATATLTRTITIEASDLVRSIFNEKPSVTDLKKEFPYMVWA